MARRLALEAALIFAANVRRDRFHDPDGVFVVDDHDGSVVDEGTSAPPPPAPEALPQAASTAIEPRPSSAPPPHAAPPRSADDPLKALLTRAQRLHELMRAQITNHLRLVQEQQDSAERLRRRTLELRQQVERLSTGARRRPPSPRIRQTG